MVDEDMAGRRGRVCLNVQVELPRRYEYRGCFIHVLLDEEVLVLGGRQDGVI